MPDAGSSASPGTVSWSTNKLLPCWPSSVSVGSWGGQNRAEGGQIAFRPWEEGGDKIQPLGRILTPVPGLGGVGLIQSLRFEPGISLAENLVITIDI